MGAGGIGIWQLAIVLAIILLLFGTKRLRSLGSDLGNAFKGFKHAMDDDAKPNSSTANVENIADHTTSTNESKKTEPL